MREKSGIYVKNTGKYGKVRQGLATFFGVIFLN